MPPSLIKYPTCLSSFIKGSTKIGVFPACTVDHFFVPEDCKTKRVSAISFSLNLIRLCFSGLLTFSLNVPFLVSLFHPDCLIILI
jgi:hypothetical protein